MKRKRAARDQKVRRLASNASDRPLLVDRAECLRTLLDREITSYSWFTVTQRRIRSFGHNTDDRKWIHMDPDRTRRESPFGAPVAHGFLILALLSRFMRKTIQIRTGVRIGINYGLNRVRFPAPVRAGQRIRARFILRSLDEIDGGFQALYDATVDVEGLDKPCCVAQWVVRYYTHTGTIS